jgi:hypothetical protein
MAKYPVPRSERDLARARAASERVTAAGGSAIEAALAAIDAAFTRPPFTTVSSSAWKRCSRSGPRIPRSRRASASGRAG